MSITRVFATGKLSSSAAGRLPARAHYRLVRTFDGPLIGGLSPREREIARLVAHGLPNKAIADVLEISAWTVATHLRRIFGKLGVTSRAAMVARVMDLEHQATAPEQ